jgi:hypothetical protein
LIHKVFLATATYAQGGQTVGRIFLTFLYREMPLRHMKWPKTGENRSPQTLVGRAIGPVTGLQAD